MNKFLILLLSCFVATSSFGQLKKLSLDDAVMQQNKQFRADRLTAFQWIPNTTRYTYIADSGKKLMTANTKDTKATELVSLLDGRPLLPNHDEPRPKRCRTT